MLIFGSILISIGLLSMIVSKSAESIFSRSPLESDKRSFWEDVREICAFASPIILLSGAVIILISLLNI